MPGLIDNQFVRTVSFILKNMHLFDFHVKASYDLTDRNNRTNKEMEMNQSAGELLSVFSRLKTFIGN